MTPIRWAFTDPSHPAYERPPDVERWPYALPGYTPQKYRSRQGMTTEPLMMAEEGHPSVRLFQDETGATVQRVTLRTRYLQYMDLGRITELAREWHRLLAAMSLGPYSLEMLREMGHPYGYGATTTPSWARLSQPRKRPSMGAAAYIKGLRGRVSDRSIINYQSGRLYESWSQRVTELPNGKGLALDFVAGTDYAWYLAHGTVSMQAHGPWKTVADRELPVLQQAWRAEATRAWQRAQAEADAMSGQFGQAQANTFGAGGFA